jgi:GNAT superfamily N-acetyltransferase
MRDTVPVSAVTSDRQLTIHRSLGADGAQAIVDLHRRVYTTEFARNEAFMTAVAKTVQDALAAGWPAAGGAVWLVRRPDGRVEGSLGLTREAESVAQLRWFVFTPALRGQGLGRRLLAELLAEARDAGLSKIELDTYTELEAAARLYLEVGFRATGDRERHDWGPAIVYRHYVLELRSQDGSQCRDPAPSPP